MLNSARYMIAHPNLLDQTPTLAGVTNAHGIRVDIYNWIQSLPMTPAQKMAMVQEAHSLQDDLLVDLNNKQALINADTEEGDAVNCVGDSFPGAFNGHEWSEGLELMTANTPMRQRAYMAYNSAPIGPSGLPSGNTCKTY